MTREEKIICKIFLDDADKTHSCNEYKLLMELLEQKPTTQERQAESDKFDAAFQDGYNNGYAQAKFDYEQQVPRWIYVRERMPINEESVLFCDIDGNIMVGYHVEGRQTTHFSQDGTYEDMKNVLAWMPLPKPYKSRKRKKG